MPRLSEFRGMIFSMFWDEPLHHRPHFHVAYGEHRASFDLAGELIVGSIPRRQRRLVKRWAKLHFDELNADWDLVREEEEPKPIDPLP